MRVVSVWQPRLHKHMDAVVSGNIYIGDTGNQRVRKIDTSGIITTTNTTISTSSLMGLIMMLVMIFLRQGLLPGLVSLVKGRGQ